MIELLIEDRCVDCDLCVDVCPVDVFDRVPDGTPVIARQADCQTCYMCEIYCPTDALYVAPLASPAPDGSPHRNAPELIERGVLGSYRARLGWGGGRKPPRDMVAAVALAGGPPEDACWQKQHERIAGRAGASLLPEPAPGGVA